MKLVVGRFRRTGSRIDKRGETKVDEQLNQTINEVLRGNDEAFADIVTQFQNGVYHVCYRMLRNAEESEDVAQETFIRAYTKLDTFDQKRKFSTWIYRIATNLCIDYLRKKKPDYSLDATVPGTEGLDMYSQLASSDDSPDDEVVTLETNDTVLDAIDQLSETYRSVIILRYLKELPLKEISEILDIPLGTVKTRVHRGREQLRKQLNDLNKGELL